MSDYDWATDDLLPQRLAYALHHATVARVVSGDLGKALAVHTLAEDRPLAAATMAHYTLAVGAELVDRLEAQDTMVLVTRLDCYQRLLDTSQDEQVTRAVTWSGQMMNAACEQDRDTIMALVKLLPEDPAALTGYLLGHLTSCEHWLYLHTDPQDRHNHAVTPYATARND